MPTNQYCLFLLVLLVCTITNPTRVYANEPSPPTQSQSSETKGIRIQPMVAEGLPVALVYVHLETSTGSVKGDNDLKQQISEAFGQSNNGTFREITVEMQLQKVKNLPLLSSVHYAAYQTMPSGRVVVVIFATPQTQTAEPAKGQGMLIEKSATAFPVIYEDHRSKLKFILNGGLGVYSDTDPWFGGYGAAYNGRNPLSNKPAGSGNLTWGEGYIEPGIGGITQCGNLPMYTYGAVTYSLSGTLGDDIYNGGSWGHGELEQLYGGVVFNLPGKGNALDVSVGKQVYQIREGFLFSKIPVSTNAGERGALYLGPRLTSKNTVLGRLKLGDVNLDAFMVEPSEIDIVKTNTRLVGTNLNYKVSKGIEAAFSFFYMADSDTTFPFKRQGLRTYNPSLWLENVAGVDGLWFKTEYAFQDNEHYDMAAHAGYAWLGYHAKEVPWKPGLSYRYALFTGDDPNTATNERFDPLFSGGLGNFLPGMVFSKAYKNSNLIIHRVKASAFPTPTLELMLDYFHLNAHRANNRGGIGPLNGTLASRNIGDEVTLSANYFMGKNYYLSAIASAGIPGSAIKQALGDVGTWYTLQASLYMFY